MKKYSFIFYILGIIIAIGSFFLLGLSANNINEEEIILKLTRDGKILTISLIVLNIICAIVLLISSSAKTPILAASIFAVTSIVFFAQKDNDMGFASVLVGNIFGIIYYPLTWIYKSFKKNSCKEIGSSIEYDSITGEKIKTERVGIFCRQSKIVNYISYSLSFVLFLIFMIVLVVTEKYLIALLIYVLLMLVVIMLNNLFQPFPRATRKFMLTADKDKYIETLNMWSQNNIHTDSKIFLKANIANILFLDSKEEGIELFESLQAPQNNLYKDQYNQIKATYYIKKGDLESAKNMLSSISNINIRQSLERAIFVYFYDDLFPSIESYYPYNTKMKFINLSNLDLLLYYSITRGLKDDAKKYAKLILDLNTNFNNLNSKCHNILDSSDNLNEE